jgi:hypothetical protein
VSIWDVELDKLQSSRLLALRMHVARYVVRVGAKQRKVVIVLGREEMENEARLLELLEAAGALAPEVVQSGADVTAADIVLVSGRQNPVPMASGQVWEISLERLADPQPRSIVESVETLIRIVMPEALGANGTPPDESVATRLA